MSEDIARRDHFVDSTVRAARAEGREIDAEAVGREVAHNLSVLDRATATGELKVPERSAPTPRERPAVNHASMFAARMSATMWEAPLTVEDERPTPKLTGVDAMRLLAMDKRIRHLMAPVPGYKLKVTRDPTTGEVTDCEPLGNQCQYPAFANRLFMEMACFSGARGTYAGMPYADRWRKYVRAVEDICNRSDAAVGVPWWVK